VSVEHVVADLVQRLDRHYYGTYRGLVVDNADPERLGRLRLRVPGVTGPDVVTGWASACVPYGGAADQGFLFVPDIGAGVWVQFEQGDLEFPIWVGTFWSKPGGESELPKVDGAVQDPPTCKIIRTAKGHTIAFEDAGGGEQITITDGVNGHEIVLDGTGITVTDGITQANMITLAAGGVTVATSGTQITVGSSGVQVGGPGATEPFVLGLQFTGKVASFLTSLATHTHVGNLGAPTSPPVAPITLEVPLSTKHTVQ
jgi:uncharacterized protein involved in type VI secretion and phage assembly